jgi:hypothetical protein
MFSRRVDVAQKKNDKKTLSILSNTPSNCVLDTGNLLESKLLHLHFAQMSRLQCLHTCSNEIQKYIQRDPNPHHFESVQKWSFICF